MADQKLTALTAVGAPAQADLLYLVDVNDTTDDPAGSSRQVTAANLLGVTRLDPGGRLTLVIGTPVPNTDTTGATFVYYGAYLSDLICLWDGTRWVWTQFATASLSFGTIATIVPGVAPTGTLTNGSPAISGLSSTTGLTIGMPISASNLPTAAVIKSIDSGTQITATVNATASGSTSLTFMYPNYDVFGYLSAGALALQAVAWTSNTTRATAISYQDGRLCKSGDKTKLYLGTVRLSGQTTGEDSVARRFVWNMYNRVPRLLYNYEPAGGWSYLTAAWRPANNNAGNRVEAVLGLSESLVEVNLSAMASSSAGNTALIALGVDTVSSPSGQWYRQIGGGGYAFLFNQAVVNYRDYPGLGYHYWQPMENGNGSTNQAFYGLSNGSNIVTGSLLA